MRTLLLLTALLASPGAFAQQDISRIETIGQYTLYAPPTHVEFWLFYSARDANLELAMADAEAFEGRLREKLQDRELQPGNFEISAPAVPDVRDNRVEISALLRFSMASFYHPQTGPGEFAKLCDRIRRIAEELESEVTGPTLDSTDRESLMRQVLVRATEDAYPAAEAIAGTLRGSIREVETVQVLEVVWNQPLEFQGTTPSVRQLALTARVRVTYTVSAQE